MPSGRLLFLGVCLVMGFLILVLLLSAFIYVKVDAKNYKVGDIVQTTFVGNPAVLTTALFGPNKEYSSKAAYGASTWNDDVANALHCDMPYGYGTFSTWLSNAGLNWQQNLAVQIYAQSTTQLYFNGQQCETDADCVSSSVNCGPGWIDPVTGQSDWNTQLGTNNYASNQCPNVAFCSLCNGFDCSGFQGSDASIGKCVLATKSAPGGTVVPYYPNWKCNFRTTVKDPVTGEIGSIKQCSAGLGQPGTENGLGGFGSYIPCDPSNNLVSLSQCTSTGSETFWYCRESWNGMLSPNFNFQCGSGLQCVRNWSSSVTGWLGSVNDTGDQSTYTAVYCASTDGGTNYTLSNEGTASSCYANTPSNTQTAALNGPFWTQSAANVCSGTANPTVQLNTTWTAQGVVTKTYDSPDIVDVQWKRVRNMYPVIGPSPLMFATCQGTQDTNCCLDNPPPGSTTCGWQGFSYDARTDRGWKYSDCRFIRDDAQYASGAKPTSRNYSVSLALLGMPSFSTDGSAQGTVDPGGWEVFADEASVYNPITTILQIFPQGVGVQVDFCNPTNQLTPQNNNCGFVQSLGPVQASTWGLGANQVPTSQLTKTYWYTIAPMEASEEGIVTPGETQATQLHTYMHSRD